jgi:MFS family permease
VTNSAPSKDTLGALNGLSQGFGSFSRALAPFIAGFLWSEFAGVDDSGPPASWPLGPYLTWNVFGIICLLAFKGSLWIGKPKRVVDDTNDHDDDDDVQSL